MPTTYLLPCQCGKKNQIDSSQAGLSVRCECGAQLAVPTMRGLSVLERVDTAPRTTSSQPAPAWGARQGLIFLGSTIIVLSALAALGLWWIRMPTPFTLHENYQEEIQIQIDQRSPEELMQLWQHLRGGIEEASAEMVVSNYEARVADVIASEMVAGGFAAVGLLLVLIGLVQRPRQAAITRSRATAAHS
jgi:hypothetical protein